MPNNNWLKNNFINLINSNSQGILGATKYNANTKKEKLLEHTYVKAFKTLPGSIFSIDVIKKCGFFIDSLELEDQDWMVRLNLHKIKIINSHDFAL